MKFHPTPELLVRYTAGTLSPALAFVVSVHIEHCEKCRSYQASLENLGGKSIESYDGLSIDEKAFESLWSNLEPQMEADKQVEETLSDAVLATDYLPILKQLVDRDYTNVDWQSVGRKIHRADIAIDDDNNQIEILRFASEAKIPSHTHKGNEYTVILDGDYTDEMGTFEQGDFIHLNGNHKHRPVAGKNGCVCIAVTDAPMHFTGLLGPVLNLFTR